MIRVEEVLLVQGTASCPPLDHRQRARQGAAGGRRAAASTTSRRRPSCARRAPTSRSSWARSATASCWTGSSATPTRCRPTSPRSWRRRSPWSSSTTPIESAFGELEHGPAVLVREGGPGARRPDPERPARLPRAPPTEPSADGALAGDRRRASAKARPRPARRATRAARGLARTSASDDVERADPMSSARRRGDRLPAALGAVRSLPPHRARARGAQHPVVQHPLGAHGHGNAFFAWMEVGLRGVRAIGGRPGSRRYRRRLAEGQGHRGLPARDGGRAGRHACRRKASRKRAWRERRAAGARGANRRARRRPTGSTPRSPRSRACSRSTAGGSRPAIRRRA